MRAALAFLPWCSVVLAAASCTLVGDLSATQCKVSSDCDSRSLAGFACERGVCVDRGMVPACVDHSDCATGTFCGVDADDVASCEDPSEGRDCLGLGALNVDTALRVGIIVQPARPGDGGLDRSVIATVETAIAQIEAGFVQGLTEERAIAAVLCDRSSADFVTSRFHPDAYVLDLHPSLLPFGELEAGKVAIVTRGLDAPGHAAAASSTATIFELLGSRESLIDPLVDVVLAAGARTGSATPTVAIVQDAFDRWARIGDQEGSNNDLETALVGADVVYLDAVTLSDATAAPARSDLVTVASDVVALDPDVLVLLVADEAFGLISAIEQASPSTTRTYVLAPPMRYAPEGEVVVAKAFADRIVGLEHFTDATLHAELEQSVSAHDPTAPKPLGYNTIYDALFMLALADGWPDLQDGLDRLGSSAPTQPEPVKGIGGHFVAAQGIFDGNLIQFEGTTGVVLWNQDRTRGKPELSLYCITEESGYRFGVDALADGVDASPCLGSL